MNYLHGDLLFCFQKANSGRVASIEVGFPRLYTPRALQERLLVHQHLVTGKICKFDVVNLGEETQSIRLTDLLRDSYSAAPGAHPNLLGCRNLNRPILACRAKITQGCRTPKGGNKKRPQPRLLPDPTDAFRPTKRAGNKKRLHPTRFVPPKVLSSMTEPRGRS